MKLNKFKQKIALSFTIFIALLTISALSSFWNLFGINKSNLTLHETTYPVVHTANYLQIELLKLANSSALAFNSQDAYSLQMQKSNLKKGAASFEKIYSSLVNLPAENVTINIKADEILKHYHQYVSYSQAMFKAQMAKLQLEKDTADEVKTIINLVNEFGAALLGIVYFAEKNTLVEMELIIGNTEQADRLSLGLIQIAQEIETTINAERLEDALRDFNFVIKDSMSWFDRSAQLLKKHNAHNLIKNTYLAAENLKKRLNSQGSLVALKREELNQRKSASQAQDAAMSSVSAAISALDSLLLSADNQFNQQQIHLASSFSYGYKNILVTLFVLVALGALHFREVLSSIRKKIGDLATLNKMGRSLTKISDKTGAARQIIQNICQQSGFTQGIALFDLEGTAWLPYGYVEINEMTARENIEKVCLMFEPEVPAEENKLAVYIANTSEDKIQESLGENLAFLTQPLYDNGALIGVIQFVGEAHTIILEDSDFEFFASAAGILVSTLKNIHMRDIIHSHNRSLETTVRQRTAALRQKSDDMASLLGNLHQGLFTISEHGFIHPEYAPFMEDIFETQNIASQHFSELLFKRSNLESKQVEVLTQAVESSIGEDKKHFDQYAESMIDRLVVHFGEGRSKDLALNWHPIVDPSNQVSKLLVSVRDITESRKAEEQRDLLSAIFKTSMEPIVIFDDELIIKAVNNAFTDKLKTKEDKVIGTELGSLFLTMQDETFFKQIKNNLKNNNAWDGEVHFDLQHRDYQICWLSISPVSETSKTNEPVYLGTFSDIRQREKVENELRYLANYDSLTNLPNRRLFSDRLENAIAMANRQNTKLALLFIDLNRFKVINDSFGHAVGDSLLKSVAERLRACLREPDVLCRLGGDEFTVLIENTKSKQNIIKVIDKILKQFVTPIVIEDRELRVGASMGISTFPEHGINAKDLMINADVAMYSAKRKNQGYQFFEPHMNIRAGERMELENDLHNALERNELFLVYQPKIDLRTRLIVGAEVLLRWQHPKNGLVVPDRFISLAEESGLIIPIGLWVLESACQNIADWQRQGFPLISLAVNVSAKQFQTDDFAATVEHAIIQNGLDPELLELELTESLLMDTEKSSIKTMNVLKKMGVSLSIDDFGTGYSSLKYLSNFPIDYLKIDRSFVMGLEDGGKNVAIIRAIIAMAKGLNLKVIAEGVENNEQATALQQFGCQIGQGYYFSRPVAEKELMSMLGKLDPDQKKPIKNIELQD
jgi:diguanylate cyclase (GGDEF)-like protein/PAS domain S-box-containing protein